MYTRKNEELDDKIVIKKLKQRITELENEVLALKNQQKVIEIYNSEIMYSPPFFFRMQSNIHPLILFPAHLLQTKKRYHATKYCINFFTGKLTTQ